VRGSTETNVEQMDLFGGERGNQRGKEMEKEE
jgi:hypothetical protein